MTPGQLRREKARRKGLDMLELHQSGETLAQIGAKYGVSRQRVHQLIAYAKNLDEHEKRG